MKFLTIFGGLFLLCFGSLELLLRLNGYGNLEIYEPDPALYWKLKPNQDCYTKIDHKPVHINSHGTRGPEFETRKPANTTRILSLGDSRTFGWGLAQAETYSGVLIGFEWRDVVTFAVLALVLIFKPGGLLGTLRLMPADERP